MVNLCHVIFVTSLIYRYHYTVIEWFCQVFIVFYYKVFVVSGVYYPFLAATPYYNIFFGFVKWVSQLQN